MTGLNTLQASSSWILTPHSKKLISKFYFAYPQIRFSRHPHINELHPEETYPLDILTD
jgi:hypothetical protein